ncbi:uncharacterized protein DUF1493 [Trinickia symbiotica]|uniref:DUF1493 domain-containing protein n=1 Tax=Trinickia symbiotica TaxID=863227 RepID=A0A2N7WS26_9BURK|nr:DUF1493 family protein [Trinickia symbiotica]PMS32152.1 DUF1493 domain-containing protein [Trinickia symbiotica]PPK41952.1 uncharacterized protein DUF1493 [Trinickia symbiotica]
MPESNETWVQLVRFFEPRLAKPIFGENRLTRNTDLYHDLDMEPDEIEQVLREWATAFDVDMSAFDLGHYYPASELNRKDFFVTLLKVPFSKRARETLGGWQLTLGMLEDAMRSGKWVI